MNNKMLPLVCDLDGTLINTDLLIESLLALLRDQFLYIFVLPLWLIRGKAYFKAQIAERVDLDVSVLPYNDVFLAYINEQRSQSRQLALATATHEKYAHAVANHLGIFEKVFATEGACNLGGAEKAAALCNAYGEKNFVYAADASKDLAVWERSGGCIPVNAAPGVVAAASKLTVCEKQFPRDGVSLKALVDAIRMHQWIKNSLVFVPLVLGHEIFEPQSLKATILAFLAFGLCASSSYVLNDLLDLEADRHHPSKRLRAFAAGEIPISHGLVTAPLLLIAAALIAVQLPSAFSLCLVVYYIATLSYSFTLKKRVAVDVIVLTGLYTARIVAGSAATGIVLSEWLLLFSMFFFLSLALVKRYTELVDLKSRGGLSEARGRGYRVDDLGIVASLGTASGYISVLVFALYLNTDTVQSLYHDALLLWAICPILLFWISRVWLVAHRGEMVDDPVVFAVRDVTSLSAGALVALILALAML